MEWTYLWFALHFANRTYCSLYASEKIAYIQNFSRILLFSHKRYKPTVLFCFIIYKTRVKTVRHETGRLIGGVRGKHPEAGK
jgi:hypothetical protein